MTGPRGKIAIVGAGSVGATLAYACLLRGVGRDIALYDTDQKKVQAQALDLNHCLQFVSPALVTGSDDPAVCRDAQAIVITAGARQKPGQSRLDLTQANAAMCRQLIPRLQAAAPGATLLMVSNPVDVLTYAVLKISGLPRNQVLGSGTVLDSSRFRFLIARRCKVAVANVHGYIVGEHGDSEIPLWSTASIGNVPLHDWSVPGHGKLTVPDRAEIFTGVKNAAQQIIAGKGATSFAVALAVVSILEAILDDASAVLPVSSLMENYCGLSHVCISVPSIVNQRGVEPPLGMPMNAAEVAGIAASSHAVQAAIASAGF